MPLWTATDNANGAPKMHPDGANGAAYANAMYDNATSGAFASKMAIGVYGVSNIESTLNGHVGPGWVAVRRGTGPITALAINAAGTGYGNLAVGSITFTGGGAATFHVGSTNSTGGVATLVLDNGGSGFINVGSATLVQPANGIYAVTINNGGTGYDNTDVITFSNGVVNATATPTTNSTGGITAVTFSSGGRGFSNTLNTVVAYKNAAGGASNGTTANVVGTIATGSGLTTVLTLGGRAGRLSYESLVAMGTITGAVNVAPFFNA